MHVLQQFISPAGTMVSAIITQQNDPEIFASWEALRGKIWIKKYQEKDLGNARERDVYDDDTRTRYIALVHGGTVVGGCRLLFDTFQKGSIEISRFCQDTQQLYGANYDELCKQFMTAIDVYVGETLQRPTAYVIIRRHFIERLERHGWEITPSEGTARHGAKEFRYAIIHSRNFTLRQEYA